MLYFSSSIVCFLCAMRVLEVRASSLSPGGYLCAKFCLFHGLHCWASPQRKIAYLLNHSPSLFDASGTEALALWNSNPQLQFLANNILKILQNYLHKKCPPHLINAATLPSEVKALTPKWPQGQNYGLALGLITLCPALSSGNFGLSLKVLATASQFSVNENAWILVITVDGKNQYIFILDDANFSVHHLN